MSAVAGKVVIVTGASGGIGEAAARLLAQAGAHVVLAARRKERLDAIAAEIRNQPDSLQPLAVECDVTSQVDRDRLVDAALGSFGRIDALINNAGYGQRGPIERVGLEQIRDNFETNLFAVIGLTQLVIPVMREQGSGRIVNVSSVAGRIARPLSSVYDATKHALEAISDGLRGELAAFGIRVVVIQPGFILTDFLETANQVSRSVLEDPGPYAPYYSNFSQASQRARKHAGHPSDIAKLILEALASPKPRLRYSAPAHAKLFLALKRVLPEGILDQLILRMMGIKGTR
ncbi:MAG: SDR family NAD(P)-dependent oxidoreductase [Acidobacteriota bacterium]